MSTGEQPAPDALAPDVLAKELENILVAHSGGKILRPKAEQIVQLQLTKLMQFYGEIATPEITASAQQQMQTVIDLQGATEALIRTGATMVEHMTPDVRQKWQALAIRVRAGVNQITEMYT